ncbi:hypothetical protein ACB098_08G073800 [Castanea mollissima]
MPAMGITQRCSLPFASFESSKLTMGSLTSSLPIILVSFTREVVGNLILGKGFPPSPTPSLRPIRSICFAKSSSLTRTSSIFDFSFCSEQVNVQVMQFLTLLLASNWHCKASAAISSKRSSAS